MLHIISSGTKFRIRIQDMNILILGIAKTDAIIHSKLKDLGIGIEIPNSNKVVVCWWYIIQAARECGCSGKTKGNGISPQGWRACEPLCRSICICHQCSIIITQEPPILILFAFHLFILFSRFAQKHILERKIKNEKK